VFILFTDSFSFAVLWTNLHASTCYLIFPTAPVKINPFVFKATEKNLRTLSAWMLAAVGQVGKENNEYEMAGGQHGTSEKK